jgi:glycosyltransferase 2 family protein
VKRILKLLASLGVTLVLTWWAFRDTDWAAQWQSLRTANYLWLLPYFGILTCIHLCRTVRWGFLLSGLERVPFRKVNEAAAIGFMMLLVMPFRLGEFARPYLIAQRSGIRKSAAMTTVVLERIADGLFVATLLWVLLWFVPAQAPHLTEIRAAATIMFAIFAAGLGFLLFALRHQATAARLVGATLGRVIPRAGAKATEVVDAFVGAMRQLPDGRRLAGFFGLTAVYWALNGLGMAMMARAFDMEFTVFQGFVVMGVLVVGVMIPAAPGMVGTFHAATKFGLLLFLPAAVVNSQGLAFANVVWLCQMVQQVGFGLLFLSVSQLSFREITENLGDEPPPPASAVA